MEGRLNKGIADLVVCGEGRVVGGVEVLRGVQVQEVTEVVVHVDSCGEEDKARVITSVLSFILPFSTLFPLLSLFFFHISFLCSPFFPSILCINLFPSIVPCLLPNGEVKETNQGLQRQYQQH